MKRAATTTILALLLGGCFGGASRDGGYYMDDGPHARPETNPHSVQKIVPRHEPLSRGGNKPYTVFGKHYVPMKSTNGYRERGVASWYGKKFHGKRTSNGETYNMYALSAAHKTLPLPSYVHVTNLDNGRSLIVRVNDRGPFLHNRLIDLSYSAASQLGIVGTGTGLVEVRAVDIDNYRDDASPAVAQQASPAKAVSSGNNIFLQTGAFSDAGNAYRLESRLKSANLGKVFVVGSSASGRTLYRVRIGPLADINALDRLTEKVKELGIHDSHIVVD